MSEDNAYREDAKYCLVDIDPDKIDNRDLLLLALVNAVLSVSLELSEINDTVRSQ